MSLSIPEHVLEFAPWSISKAGMLEKCSMQFHMKHKLKIKERATFEQSRLGVAVHRALELALEGVPVRKAFEMARLESEATETESEQINTFIDQVDRFVKRMAAFKTRERATDVLIERKLALKTDFTSTHFFDKTGLLRGVVDYGVITNSGYMVIIDHKTGKEKELKEYDKQFHAYCLMALAQWPQLKGVQTAINFVMTDHLVWNPMVKAEQIREEYRLWLIKYLTETCEALKTAPVAKKTWACDWCPYGPKAAKPVCTLFGGTGRDDEVHE